MNTGSRKEEEHFFFLRQQQQTVGNASNMKIKLKSVRRSNKNTRALVEDSEGYVPLTNYQDVLYLADIQVENTTFTVQVDTGSSDLWVSCAYIVSMTCSQSCPMTSAVIQYGSGSVCIVPYSADIQVGNVSINNYAIGVAQGANVQPQASDPILIGGAQGILGLAYPSIAVVPSPSGQFIQHVDSFSMYLTWDDKEESSFMIINGVDEAYIAKNNMKGYDIPLKSPSHWTLGLTKFAIGDHVVDSPCSTPNKRSCDAIVDSGTSLLTMPMSIYSQLVEKHLIPNGCLLETNGIFLCPKKNINQLPTLSLTLASEKKNDNTFILQPQDYLQDYSTSIQWMIVGIQATPSGVMSDFWILGDTFLRNYYTSYNVNKSVTFYCGNGGKCFGGSMTSNGESNGDTSWRTLSIVLIVIGGVLGVALLIMGFFYCKNRQKRQLAKSNTSNNAYQNGAPLTPMTA